MELRKGLGISAMLLILLTGCATRKQAKQMDEQLGQISQQLELLLENTRRDTLNQIFGEQTSQILNKVDELDGAERQEFEEFVSQYQKGSSDIEAVRSGMVSLLGGGDREVASAAGIWVRDSGGEKVEAISRGTQLSNCRQLEAQEIPEAIRAKEQLNRYQWGSGQLGDQKVIFPWEFTMSSFTKEIVENTARRTAEEMRKMAGEGEFNRPIYIQVTTDPTGEGVKIKYPTEDGEIYLNQDAPASETDSQDK